EIEAARAVGACRRWARRVQASRCARGLLQDPLEQDVDPAAHDVDDRVDVAEIDREPRRDLAADLVAERVASRGEPARGGCAMNAVTLADLVDAPTVDEAVAEQRALAFGEGLERGAQCIGD